MNLIKVLLLLAIQKRRGYPEHMRLYLSLPLSCMSTQNDFDSIFFQYSYFSYDDPERASKTGHSKKTVHPDALF